MASRCLSDFLYQDDINFQYEKYNIIYLLHDI